MTDTSSPTVALYGALATAAVALILGIAGMYKDIRTGRDERGARTVATNAEGVAKHAEAMALENKTYWASAKESFGRIDRERQEYKDRLDAMSARFYALLDGLEEDVYPVVMMIHDDDPILGQLKIAMRALIRRARQPDKAAPTGEKPPHEAG